MPQLLQNEFRLQPLYRPTGKKIGFSVDCLAPDVGRSIRKTAPVRYFDEFPGTPPH
jgi:hypothetical protein